MKTFLLNFCGITNERLIENNILKRIHYTWCIVVYISIVFDPFFFYFSLYNRPNILRSIKIYRMDRK